MECPLNKFVEYSKLSQTVSMFRGKAEIQRAKPAGEWGQ